MGSVIRADLAKQRADLQRRLDALRRGRGPVQGVGPTIVRHAPAPWPENMASEIGEVEDSLAEIDRQLRHCNNANRCASIVLGKTRNL
jgi:hypothetical protein